MCRLQSVTGALPLPHYIILPCSNCVVNKGLTNRFTSDKPLTMRDSVQSRV